MVKDIPKVSNFVKAIFVERKKANKSVFSFRFGGGNCLTIREVNAKFGM
jgi:hypothetical protein